MKGLVLGILLFGVAYADEFEVKKKSDTAVEITVAEVTGYGDTRDAALKDALRAAVERAVGVMVSAETKVKNMELIEDKVYTQSRGFVKKYDVISSEKEGSTYKTAIKAEVSRQKLKEEFKRLGISVIEVDGKASYAGVESQRMAEENAKSYIKNEFIKLFPKDNELFSAKVLDFSTKDAGNMSEYTVKFEIIRDNKTYEKMRKEIEKAIVEYGLVEKVSDMKDGDSNSSIAWDSEWKYPGGGGIIEFRGHPKNSYWRQYRIKKLYIDSFYELFRDINSSRGVGNWNGDIWNERYDALDDEWDHVKKYEAVNCKEGHRRDIVVVIQLLSKEGEVVEEANMKLGLYPWTLTFRYKDPFRGEYQNNICHLGVADYLDTNENYHWGMGVVYIWDFKGNISDSKLQEVSKVKVFVQ